MDRVNSGTLIVTSASGEVVPKTVTGMP